MVATGQADPVGVRRTRRPDHVAQDRQVGRRARHRDPERRVAPDRVRVDRRAQIAPAGQLDPVAPVVLDRVGEHGVAHEESLHGGQKPHAVARVLADRVAADPRRREAAEVVAAGQADADGVGLAHRPEGVAHDVGRGDGPDGVEAVGDVADDDVRVDDRAREVAGGDLDAVVAVVLDRVGLPARAEPEILHAAGEQPHPVDRVVGDRVARNHGLAEPEVVVAGREADAVGVPRPDRPDRVADDGHGGGAAGGVDAVDRVLQDAVGIDEGVRVVAGGQADAIATVELHDVGVDGGAEQEILHAAGEQLDAVEEVVLDGVAENARAEVAARHQADADLVGCGRCTDRVAHDVEVGRRADGVDAERRVRVDLIGADERAGVVAGEDAHTVDAAAGEEVARAGAADERAGHPGEPQRARAAAGHLVELHARPGEGHPHLRQADAVGAAATDDVGGDGHEARIGEVDAVLGVGLEDVAGDHGAQDRGDRGMHAVEVAREGVADDLHARGRGEDRTVPREGGDLDRLQRAAERAGGEVDAVAARREGRTIDGDDRGARESGLRGAVDEHAVADGRQRAEARIETDGLGADADVEVDRVEADRQVGRRDRPPKLTGDEGPGVERAGDGEGGEHGPPFERLEGETAAACGRPAGTGPAVPPGLAAAGLRTDPRTDRNSVEQGGKSPPHESPRLGMACVTPLSEVTRPRSVRRSGEC